MSSSNSGDETAFRTPAHDPPAASASPLQGQHEANRRPEPDTSSPVQSAGERKPDYPYAAAYEFGWQSRLQYGRSAATTAVSFEKAEPELEKLWGQRQEAKNNRLPWQAARDTAHDAWNQVYDALASDSQAKTNTNG